MIISDYLRCLLTHLSINQTINNCMTVLCAHWCPISWILSHTGILDIPPCTKTWHRHIQVYWIFLRALKLDIATACCITQVWIFLCASRLTVTQLSTRTAVLHSVTNYTDLVKWEDGSRSCAKDVDGSYNVLPAYRALVHALAAGRAGYHVSTLQEYTVDGGIHANLTQVVLIIIQVITCACDT